MPARTRVIDRGFKKFMREMRKIEKRPHVKIGFPAESNDTTAIHGGSKFRVVDIALVHEFGTQDGVIPERSWMRTSFAESMQKNLKMTRRLANQINTGSMTISRALNIMGLLITAQQRAKIRTNIPPPLKKRKGIALIDTAQMINSITHKVKL